MRKKRLNLLIPTELLETMTELARNQDVSRNTLIVKAIEEYVSRHSGTYGIKATMAEAQDVIDRLTRLMNEGKN